MWLCWTHLHLPKAETDWNDNYQESYAMKQDDLKTLQEQLSGRKGEAKRVTESRINTLTEQLKEMETEFLKKYAPEEIKLIS